MMNRFEDAILKQLMRRIEEKNSWGKNELKFLIGDLAIDVISQVRPIKKTSVILPKKVEDTFDTTDDHGDLPWE